MTAKKNNLLRGRFGKETNACARRFSASHTVDRRMYVFDILGSIAHARMLESRGLISRRELNGMVKGLNAIRDEIESGRFPFDDSLEDIHMHVESRLTELAGEAGKKLHTGRSRNDQVALDFQMYCRESCRLLIRDIERLMKILLERAEAHEAVFMPAYTHLQQAQVIRAAHHFLAYCNMFDRDRDRLRHCLKGLESLPLGSGALAGTGLGNDRKRVARELGFPRLSDNSLDAVSNRDFALELLFAVSMIALHLSRYCEEIVLWYTSEFDMITLDESWCTGSSLLPQKQNPDIAELIRGKTGRFLGNLVNLFTTLKALPLAYNRDLQEDKEAVFDSVGRMRDCLEAFSGMIATLEVKPDILERLPDDYMLAVDVAEYLVRKGEPFRNAHAATGKLVRYALSRQSRLKDIGLERLKEFSPRFDADVYPLLDLRKSPDTKNTYGGTSLREVRRQVRRWKKVLGRPGKTPASRKHRGVRSRAEKE
jgi:argininosuccinate lyase